MFSNKKFETEFAGRKLTVEVGKLAQQCNGACLVQYGDTVVLATAVMGKEPKTGIDFFPLTVEMQEKMYAAENSRVQNCQTRRSSYRHCA